MPSKFLSHYAQAAEPAETSLIPGSDHGARKVHAALTRSSTGTADLRELESGLDSLQSDAGHKARIDWSRILLPVAALVVPAGGWQMYVSLGIKRRDLVPGPLDVAGPVRQLCGPRASCRKPSGPRCSAGSSAS